MTRNFSSALRYHRSGPAPNFVFMNANDDLQTRWWNLEAQLAERFGKKPDMESILFLIGIQETNKFDIKFSKEEKQDLMHVAVCTLLSTSGYYELDQYDEEGWPHFRQLKPLPEYGLKEQEDFLRDHILHYFEQQNQPSDQ
jgi:hypothetical protein